jgi:hypothetical protein
VPVVCAGVRPLHPASSVMRNATLKTSSTEVAGRAGSLYIPAAAYCTSQR